MAVVSSCAQIPVPCFLCRPDLSIRETSCPVITRCAFMHQARWKQKAQLETVEA